MFQKILLSATTVAILLPSVAMAKPLECPSACDRINGDVDGDGYVGYNDVSTLYRWLYAGRSKGLCVKAADINGDGVVDISDAIGLGNYVWKGGPAPVSLGLPGDVNDDGDIDISDMVTLGRWLWAGTGEVCSANADVNQDGYIDVSDMVALSDML
jgi:hypothetical protein